MTTSTATPPKRVRGRICCSTAGQALIDDDLSDESETDMVVDSVQIGAAGVAVLTLSGPGGKQLPAWAHESPGGRVVRPSVRVQSAHNTYF
jgi:hypothetical protein